MGLRPVDKAVSFWQVKAKEKVLGDVQSRHKSRNLVDKPDTGMDRVVGGSKGNRPFAQNNLPGIMSVNPSQDFNQCGFAGPIFSYQSVDFTVLQLK